ncbi:het-c2 protein [Chiua virens]|nr:het-c2 protein [Chiua virens]
MFPTLKMESIPSLSSKQQKVSSACSKVRTRYLAHPDKSTTLELLILNEQSESKRPATDGLMWLLRGLLFTHQALHTAQKEPDIELAKAFTKGYDASLKQYHNFIVKGIFSVAMKACPYRKDFYTKLATDPIDGTSASSDKVNEALDRWLEGLDKTVMQMQRVYKEKGYGQI